MVRWICIASSVLVLACAAWLASPPRAGAGEEAEGGVEVGKAAPDFRVNDADGRALRLGAHGKGRWKVLAFFPKASTPG